MYHPLFLISHEEHEVDKLTTVPYSPLPQYSFFFFPPDLNNLSHSRGLWEGKNLKVDDLGFKVN